MCFVHSELYSLNMWEQVDKPADTQWARGQHLFDFILVTASEVRQVEKSWGIIQFDFLGKWDKNTLLLPVQWY